ncbi:MAG: PilZ domain-containing protein [Pseudomonadota bacterium]
MSYREPRRAIDGQAQIMTDAGPLPVAIRNVSSLGVNLVGAPAMQRAQRIELVLAGRVSAATVMWCRNGRCGVRLDEPLGDDDLAILRKIPKAGVAGPRRPTQGFTASRFREL